jgi:hypothetical protein
MRWFWLWRLRVANHRLAEALDNLPDGWKEDPHKYVEEIAEWRQAHLKVVNLLNRLL